MTPTEIVDTKWTFPPTDAGFTLEQIGAASGIVTAKATGNASVNVWRCAQALERIANALEKADRRASKMMTLVRKIAEREGL